MPGPIPAEVIRVIDGDTIEVRARIWVDQEVLTSVRLEGVDTPEIRGPECEAERIAAEAASAYVRALALDRVSLRDVQWGTYAGRVVARIELPDGSDLTERLLAAYLGVPYGEEHDWCAVAAAQSADGRD
ncbi:MAG: hypothetical protein PVI23_03885 [Maricaulaceae bacterium]